MQRTVPRTQFRDPVTDCEMGEGDCCSRTARRLAEPRLELLKTLGPRLSLPGSCAGAHTPRRCAVRGASRCHGDRLHGDQKQKMWSPEVHPACLLCSDAYSGRPGSQHAFRVSKRALPPRRGDGWKGKRLKPGGRRVGRMAGSSAAKQDLVMPISMGLSMRAWKPREKGERRPLGAPLSLSSDLGPL